MRNNKFGYPVRTVQIVCPASMTADRNGNRPKLGQVPTGQRRAAAMRARRLSAMAKP